MTEQPGNYPNTPTDRPSDSPSLEHLRLECHALIDRIARRSLGFKLLLGARQMLQISAGYKAGRGDRFLPQRGNDSS